MTWNMVNFQDFNSYTMMLMTEFHDLSLLILLFIMLFIMYVIYWYMYNVLINKNILFNHLVEVIWTIIPMFILIYMIIPSLKILYMVDELFNPYLTLKILGNQWYWSYEYSDFVDIDFDSFMINDYSSLMFRLLDVDNRVILPYNLNIRGLLSSNDVIHSWAMPVLGIKVDAIPGRMNQFIMFLDRLGVYFGQCSEICGLNHSFMPIVIESVNMKGFLNWLKNN